MRTIETSARTGTEPAVGREGDEGKDYAAAATG